MERHTVSLKGGGVLAVRLAVGFCPVVEGGSAYRYDDFRA